MSAGVIAGLVILVIISILLALLIRSTKKAERLSAEKKQLERENEAIQNIQGVDVPDSHDERIKRMSEW